MAQAQASGCSLRRYMLLKALPTRAELQVHSSTLRRGWRTPPLWGMRKTMMTIQIAFLLHIDSLGDLRYGAELKVHFSDPRRKSISRLHDEDENIEFSDFLWSHSLRLREQCEVTIPAQQEDPVVERRNRSICCPILRHAELSESFKLAVLQRNQIASFSSLSRVSSNAKTFMRGEI